MQALRTMMCSSGGRMRQETMMSEARKCRDLAVRYFGRPEQRLLVNVAAAFEDLARKRNGDHRFQICQHVEAPASR